jgi:NAD(P)H-flavin reductase
MRTDGQRLDEAVVVERVDESPTIFTLRLRFRDPERQRQYCFRPGQFNMLYLFGVGEIPISIVSDPGDDCDTVTCLDHTIRIVGRVTRGMARLQAGDSIGIRGPYGRGWPLEKAKDRDVVIITGGLGCAPSVSVIEYIIKRRPDYGRLTVIQGVKHFNDLLWHDRYDRWAAEPDTHVLLAADHGGPIWPWHTGPVTDLFDRIHLVPEQTLVMLCGPEGMMKASIQHLVPRGVAEDAIWLSMERNMQCALGQCGHCQYQRYFVCRDGPVFCYADISDIFGIRGV